MIESLGELRYVVPFKILYFEMGTNVGLFNYNLQFICDKLISCFMSNLHMKEQHSHETKIYIVHELVGTHANPF